MSKENLNVNDALNEYFRLKNKFESDNKLILKKIVNNPHLSKKEKREEYLQLKPKCVNCKIPSKNGTLFSVIYKKSDDKEDAYRIFKASCGNLTDPCNLNIHINVGNVENVEKLIRDIRSEIDTYKNKIIDEKNKLLFGLMTENDAINNFDEYKNYITTITAIYEDYLNLWNKIYENPDKKIELDESIVKSYESINNIKDCIKNFNETNNTKYASDAANIYITVLEPLLKKIRYLKYSENIVFHEDNKCKLIQNQVSMEDLGVAGYRSRVVAFDVGLKPKQSVKKEKRELIIEESSEESLNIPEEGKEIPMDVPIIGEGEDGIKWNNQLYQKLWNGLPSKLKSEFKLNINWMNNFMHKCVNERQKGKNGCELVTPPNLIIPPELMPNGEYNFGVSIYNKVFSKLPKDTRLTYLKLYSVDKETGEKNYKMLEEAMNKLVGQELDFDRGFF